MTLAPSSGERRAQRLVRWYPASWRERYGEEFCALLESEFGERRTSLRRTVDIACGGLVARATLTGLVGIPRDARQHARASLAWLVAALGAFLVFGVAMWSQLVVAWQWTPPRTAGTTWATIAMSVAVAAFMVLGLASTVPIVATVLCRIGRGGARRLAVPGGLCASSVALLVIGARAFENGWPGTGGRHWAHQGMVPGGLGAFVWASTLGVTSYWAHPGALRHFPELEVAWMALSPLVIAVAVAGAATTLRRLELSSRVARFELRLGLAASGVMGVFLVGAVLWLCDHQRPRSIPTNLFHVGAIDLVGAVVMALAMLIAIRASTWGLSSWRATSGVTASS